MSTITAPPRGLRVPPLFIVLAIVAVVVLAAVIAFALNSESADDTRTPAVEASAAQSQTNGSATAAERVLRSSVPLYQDDGPGPGRPYKDSEISEGLLPVASNGPGRPVKDAEISR